MTNSVTTNENRTDYFDSFKKLYYHLYSNSNASRAERIIGDLSRLLLVALAKNSNPKFEIAVKSFLGKNGDANTLLSPIIQKKYNRIFANDSKFYLDNPSLRHGLESISHLDLFHAKSHLLGEAFQALIGPNLRGDKGQFFTPKSIVRCMVKVVSPKPNWKVVDPACGTGGFLIETASFWEEQTYKGKGTLVGIDKDTDLSMLSSALLELTAPKSGVVLNQNALDYSSLKKLPSDVSPVDADCILTNPPFGAKIPIKEEDVLKQFSLGHIWIYSKSKNIWEQTNKVRSSQDPQILFIELSIKLLKNDGVMGIILPEGVFGNTSSGYVLDYLRQEGEIFGLIDCPRTSFQPGTDTKTNILFFKKSNKKKNLQPKISVALNCGHDRRGRTVKSDGKAYPDDFTEIAQDWDKTNHEYWFESKVTNKYYLVPRYYDRKTSILLEEDAQKLNAKIISLGEMISNKWISLKKGHEVGSDAYGTGDIPFIRTSDISNFEISIDPTKSISEEVYDSLKKEQGLKSGSILMVVDGRYRIGKCAILHETNYKCVAQSHLRIINVNKNAPFSSYELLYLLSLTSVQRDIRSLVFIQSTLGSVGSRIKEIKVPVPAEKNNKYMESISTFSHTIMERAKLLNILSCFEGTMVDL